MDPLWRTALWQQFGATIDVLENALLACPSTHWRGRLWSDHSEPEFAEFWSITYHTLFWLDLYLTGSREGFAPPAPFTLDEPKRPYTKEELHAYLVHLRQKCQTTIAGLSDEQAHQQVAFPWIEGKPVSFLELLLYNGNNLANPGARNRRLVKNDRSTCLRDALTSFHGRGFFPGLGSETTLHNPPVVLAAVEAVVGLFIEISFIATFTQRYFGK